ncbi:MAG TPA: CPBP family intramembrane glutamic endopeptidase [Candidatus Acidoferrales bacterium]|nr:CPBP family intramembrane glutamic endopeptidase [Candidatus Acidoferrales bacterium]
MSLREVLRRIGVMLGGMAVLAAVVFGAQQVLRHRIPVGLEAIVLLALAFGVYVLYVRLTERRRVDELAPAVLLPQTLLGLAIGVAIFTTVIGLLVLTGTYHYQSYTFVPGLLTAFAVTAVGAVREELFFRGFLFRVVQSIGGTWVGVAVSAVIFGALHLLNPHATILSAVAIAIEAGILLAVAYTASRHLWLPIGIHIAWNFTEGSVFGVAVSGHAAVPSLIHGTLTGPALRSGGSFGIEASGFAVLVCCVASALIVAYALRKGLVVPFAPTAVR